MFDWTPCGLGVCAAESGHDGTCAEASGWDEPAECFTADSTHGERFCHTHGEEHTTDRENGSEEP